MGLPLVFLGHSIFIPDPSREGRSYLPVIKAAGPHQKQGSHWHPALLLNRGEAAGEVYEKDQEKRDIPAHTNSSDQWCEPGKCFNPFPSPNHAHKPGTQDGDQAFSNLRALSNLKEQDLAASQRSRNSK